MKWRYWQWLFRGISGRAGITKFIDRWLLLHILVALFLTHFITTTLKDEAVTLILPLAGVFIGLTFAWSGNAQALMQSDDLAEMFDKHADGLENYVYTFQTAVLCLLVTIIGWGLAGLGLFQNEIFLNANVTLAINFGLFLLSSISVRECWGVIMGSQFFVLAQRSVQKKRKAM